MDDSETRLYEKYDSLIARYGDMIERFCMLRSMGNRSRCAELRADCYISLWRYLPSLREGASPRQEAAWVIWNCRSAFSHFRYRRQTHQFLPLSIDIADSVPAVDNTAEDLLDETLDALSSLLTPRERQAFGLIAKGYSAEDLAKELGIKHRSAVLLRHRIIEKLRNNFASRSDSKPPPSDDS